jgi:hypothetical protein
MLAGFVPRLFNASAITSPAQTRRLLPSLSASLRAAMIALELAFAVIVLCFNFMIQ